jgi:hypothetical protein
MVTLAGWLGIAFNRPRLVRTYAIIFGIILWILLSLPSFGSEFGLLYDTISVLIGLIAYLAYGILLARFFPRFKRNITETKKRPGWAIDVQGKRMR